MKTHMRTRFDSVTERLEKATREAASGEAGILGLYNLQEAEKTAGKLLFDLVMNEEGSQAELRELVSHAALFEIIIASIDHRSGLMSRVNQNKSRDSARKNKAVKISKLHDWLEQNIDRYRKKLDLCAEHAVKQIEDLGMSEGAVKKYITAYRKEKKLGASE